MFIPYPSWFFPIPGPFSLRELIEDTKNETGTIASHFDNIHNLRAIPIWRMRDTPLRLRSIFIFCLTNAHLATGEEEDSLRIDGLSVSQTWGLINSPVTLGDEANPMKYPLVGNDNICRWPRSELGSHHHLKAYSLQYQGTVGARY
jgi:hypothetical protein